MSRQRQIFTLDTDHDAALIARLADLAGQGKKSETIRAALYAYLFPEQHPSTDTRAILAELADMRAEIAAIGQGQRPPGAPAAGEDPALAAALDAQLDDFFST